jgi:hypothetical protein
MPSEAHTSVPSRDGSQSAAHETFRAFVASLLRIVRCAACWSVADFGDIEPPVAWFARRCVNDALLKMRDQ